MVSAECVTVTTTTTENNSDGSPPTTLVRQSSILVESPKDLGATAAQGKQSGSKGNGKVTRKILQSQSQPQPFSVSSVTPSVSTSPSALVSGSRSASALDTSSAPVSVPQRPLNMTGPSPPPLPLQQQLIHNPAIQAKSESPLSPLQTPMQAKAHPPHSQGNPSPIHYQAALPLHPYHMFHPHYPPPPPHPHMYHHQAVWHHPPHPPHPSNAAAYIKPYSAVMRSQPSVKRTSKYMLKEQGGGARVPSPKGSNRTSIPREVESSSQLTTDSIEETKEDGRAKRPASEMSDSSDKEQKNVPQDLRNKKMKPTDCLLFAASLLATEKKENGGDNENANGGKGDASAALDDSKYITTGVKPAAKKIFQAPILSVEEEKDNDENFPKDVDVLCGRGGLINKHPGNVAYRKIVDYNKPYYQRVHKKHRILVSQSIVQSILNFGGRFMIMEKGKDWTQIEFKRAVQKTSQALRERITEEETNEEEEDKTENSGSKTSEDDEAEGGDDDDDDDEGEGEEEGFVVKSENISGNRNGIAKGTLAI